MAQDKIINRILQDAQNEANKLIEDAHKQADNEVTKINNQTGQRLLELKKEFENNSKELERRAKLNANLQERKDVLAIKQDVMKMAFEEAKQEMKNLSDEDWKSLIKKIIIAGTVTDTEYIKVPEKDFSKYTSKVSGSLTFLDEINNLLKENGHLQPLKLDKNPAHFSDGLMLIGKYSDVNASFDVLIENMKENLEWNVSKILFKQ